MACLEVLREGEHSMDEELKEGHVSKMQKA